MNDAIDKMGIFDQPAQKDPAQIALLKKWADLLWSGIPADAGVLLQMLEEGRKYVDAQDPNRSPASVVFSNPVSATIFSKKGWAAIVLIEHGEPIDTRDQDGRTPLHLACNSGLASVARLLVAKGADIEARSKLGNSPLHEACQNGDRAIAELLLDAGADIETKGDHGATPLHKACWSENTETCLSLLVRGANAQALDDLNHTPLYALLAGGGDPVAAARVVAAFKAFDDAVAARKAIDGVLDIAEKRSGPIAHSH